MDNNLKYDKNLWFEHLGCKGKHYLIGNPHTYVGRMWAWCPKEERTFFVSKADMGEMSEQAKFWVQGFLNGHEPDPPVNEDGDVDFESLEYKTWTEAMVFFHETGFWTDQERKCEKCGKMILKSEPGVKCMDCN